MHSRQLWLVAILAALLWGLPVEAGPASLFTVVSALDDPDASPGNGVCADSHGNCTLRAAVMEANAHVGPDTIILLADTFQLDLAGSSEDAAATGDLDLKGNVTLQGAGAASSIVDATGLADRVLTLTRALGPGSAALDAGDPAGCAASGGLLLFDQRGFPRRADGNHDGQTRCDMGAFEVQLKLFLPLLRR
jgi:CSLREA domain-containing protein